MLHFDVTYTHPDRTTTVQMRHRGGMLRAVDHTLREYPDAVVTITPLGDDDEDPTLNDLLVYRLVARRPGTGVEYLRCDSRLSDALFHGSLARLLDKDCVVRSGHGFKVVSDTRVRERP